MDDDFKLKEDSDAFVFISCNQEEVQALIQEKLKEFRKGNSDINLQLMRDIEMLTQAIVCYGSLESDKIKARTLLKCILFLYFGDICYRDFRDNKFYSWNKLNAYSNLDSFPIASVLLHGSRVLIEFPSEISYRLIDWLITDKSSWRYMATHGIIELKDNETEQLESGLSKHLKEVKVSLLSAAISTVAKPMNALISLFGTTARCIVSSVSTESTEFSAAEIAYLEVNNIAQHYGINLALGGIGKKNFFSNKTISSNGEHGHLYFCYGSGNGEYAGLLIGIEQSAPGKSDQYGGVHDPVASKKNYSASGGDFFFKKLEESVYDALYVGLKKLPFAGYYDNIWNTISNENFIVIQKAYKKASALLDLLPENEGLSFIRDIVSSSGKQASNDFEELFNHYFKKNSKKYFISQNLEQGFFKEKNQELACVAAMKLFDYNKS